MQKSRRGRGAAIRGGKAEKEKKREKIKIAAPAAGSAVRPPLPPTPAGTVQKPY